MLWVDFEKPTDHWAYHIKALLFFAYNDTVCVCHFSTKNQRKTHRETKRLKGRDQGTTLHHVFFLLCLWLEACYRDQLISSPQPFHCPLLGRCASLWQPCLLTKTIICKATNDRYVDCYVWNNLSHFLGLDQQPTSLYHVISTFRWPAAACGQVGSACIDNNNFNRLDKLSSEYYLQFQFSPMSGQQQRSGLPKKYT